MALGSPSQTGRGANFSHPGVDPQINSPLNWKALLSMCRFGVQEGLSRSADFKSCHSNANEEYEYNFKSF